MYTNNKLRFHFIVLLFGSVILCIGGCSTETGGQVYMAPAQQSQQLPDEQRSPVKDTSRVATVRFVPETSEAPLPGSQGDYVDGQHAWVVVGFKDIRRTVDGGRTWQRMRPAAEYESAFKWLLYMPVSVSFITPTLGWLTGNDVTWQSDDGGGTWRQIFSGSSSGLYFADAQHGWRQIYYNKTGYQSYVTRDGGATWQLCGAVRSKGQIPDTAYFITPQLGWAITSYTDEDRQTIHGVARTTDGGCHWQQVWVNDENPDERFSDLHFINNREGWLAGEYRLYYTVDGGKTWQEVHLPIEDVQLSSVYFADSNNGWVIAAPKTTDNNTGMYRTTDGGRRWRQLTINEITSSARGEIPTNWKAGKLLQMLYESHRINR